MGDPYFRFGNISANPEGDGGGEDADEEDGAPVGVTQDDAGDEGGERESDGPGALHDGEGFGAEVVRPGFGDEGGAGVPLAAHAEAEDEADDGEHEHGGGEAGGERADGVSEDAEHEGALASDAVGEEAEKNAADAGGEQHERGEDAGGALGHGEVAHDMGEDERVKHGVEGVEHPAEGGGEEGAALGGGGLAEELDGAWGHCGDCSSGEGTLPISLPRRLPEQLLNRLHQHEESVGVIWKVYESVAQVEASRLLILGIYDNG